LAGINIERQIFSSLVGHLDSPDVTVLIGPRQVGKTTLLDALQELLLQQKAIKPNKILRFNLDLESDQQNFESQEEFIKLLKLKCSADKLYVFVDEAQKIDEPGRFFKGIFDLKLNLKLVLTGSSALEIRSKIGEALTGRKKIFQIHPFSFEEFLAAKNTELLDYLSLDSKQLPKSQIALLKDYYCEYMVYGGYPKVVKAANHEEKLSELDEIYQSYIDKDVIGLLKVGDALGFRKLLRLLAGQISGLINIGASSSDVELSSQTTTKYLDILEQTYVVFRLSPYYSNPSTELKKSRKYYFYDNGLRNFILNNLDAWHLRSDQGQLFENSVAQTLIRKVQSNEALHYWRSKSKAEVDFVYRTRAIMPYEAKLKYQFTRSYRSFMTNYKLQEGYLVNLEEEQVHDYGDFVIKSILPWYL